MKQFGLSDDYSQYVKTLYYLVKVLLNTMLNRKADSYLYDLCTTIKHCLNVDKNFVKTLTAKRNKRIQDLFKIKRRSYER